MATYKIEICEVLFIEQRVLIVFYTPSLGYQFRILNEDGIVSGTQELYSTFDMAMKVAKQSLSSGLV